MNQTRLKRCPFFGGKAELIQDRKKFYFVRCNRCLCSTWPSRFLDRAEKNWNDRVSGNSVGKNCGAMKDA